MRNGPPRNGVLVEYLRATRSASTCGESVSTWSTCVALAAVADPADGAPIVAVGRFHGDGGGRSELAVLVDDAHQHVGLGRLLLGRLPPARRAAFEP
jgi:hypothetical protein